MLSNFLEHKSYYFPILGFRISNHLTSICRKSGGSLPYDWHSINWHFFLYFLWQIPPYPSQAKLEQKMQDQANWDSFKTQTINTLLDTLHL